MAVVPFRDPQLPDRRDDDEEDREAGGKMSFLEHLEEFRKRLVKSLIAVGVGMAIAFLFIGRIYEFVMVPLARMLPEGGHLIYTEPAEAFLLNLKIALLAGVIIVEARKELMGALPKAVPAKGRRQPVPATQGVANRE